MLSLPALERDLVVSVCAISAGVHAALVPDQFHEGAGAGTGFLVAALLLASLVVVLTVRPAGLGGIAVSGALLAGLLASYGLAATTGIPLLHPERESIDGLALATKAIEGAGLLAALHLIGSGRPAVAAGVIHTKGVQT